MLRPALSEILSRIRAALKPDGLHFASYKGGGEAGRDGNGRYFNYLSRAEAIDAYRQSGQWKILSCEEYIGGGYEGGQGPWIAVTAMKRE